MSQHAAPPEAAYQRFKRLLPAIQTPELIVLKGHLLVEAELDRYLEATCSHPQFLADTRLSFHQKAFLVRALGGMPGGQSLWAFIVHLNSLRNRLAHRLEPGNVSQQVDGLLRVYWEDEFITPTSNRQRSTRTRQALAFVIAEMHGFTEGYIETRRLASRQRARTA